MASQTQKKTMAAKKRGVFTGLNSNIHLLTVHLSSYVTTLRETTPKPVAR